jgi:tRNA(Ile2) C34 agmatinyltransferase TiaS
VVKVTKMPTAREQGQVGRCHRCGGLMVSEKVFELGSFDWRCVSCGNRVDPVILAHREAHHPKSLAREEAEKLFIGLGKSRLN